MESFLNDLENLDLEYRHNSGSLFGLTNEQWDCSGNRILRLMMLLNAIYSSTPTNFDDFEIGIVGQMF
jgi:hypothetical protein